MLLPEVFSQSVNLSLDDRFQLNIFALKHFNQVGAIYVHVTVVPDKNLQLSFRNIVIRELQDKFEWQVFLKKFAFCLG